MIVYIKKDNENTYKVLDRAIANKLISSKYEIYSNIDIGDKIIGYAHEYKVIRKGINRKNEIAIWCIISNTTTINNNPRIIKGVKS